jgi:hypothetical protein
VLLREQSKLHAPSRNAVGFPAGDRGCDLFSKLIEPGGLGTLGNALGESLASASSDIQVGQMTDPLGYFINGNMPA